MGRFINADVVYDFDAGLQGFNLFIYCGNDPINRIDSSGADSDGITEGEDMLDKPLLEGGGASGGNGYIYDNGAYSSQSSPTSPVKVNANALKNVDVHSFKKMFVGSDGARWDIFKDTTNNSMLWLGNKSQTQWKLTGYLLQELIEFFRKGWK